MIEQISEIKQGKSANSSKWTFTSNHLGTHVDVPKHFFDNGKTITDYNPQDWIFNQVQVLDIPVHFARLIEIKEIESKIQKGIDLLLLRTGYEKFRKTEKYWNDNPGIAPELCQWLKKEHSNIRAIGFDFISLSSWKFRTEGKEAHKILLGNEDVKPILIIEDMSFVKLRNDTIIEQVLIAPILIISSNGAPVTVFANIRFSKTKVKTNEKY